MHSSIWVHRNEDCHGSSHSFSPIRNKYIFIQKYFFTGSFRSGNRLQHSTIRETVQPKRSSVPPSTNGIHCQRLLHSLLGWFVHKNNLTERNCVYGYLKRRASRTQCRVFLLIARELAHSVYSISIRLAFWLGRADSAFARVLRMCTSQSSSPVKAFIKTCFIVIWGTPE